jgi:ABC-type uncharacterized transport system fused permease/ATPase subunit
MAFSSLSRLLEFIESFANLSGLIHRVSAFDDALSRCEQKSELAKSELVTHQSSDVVAFEGVDIFTPRDEVTLSHLNACLSFGTILELTLAALTIRLWRKVFHLKYIGVRRV